MDDKEYISKLKELSKNLYQEWLRSITWVDTRNGKYEWSPPDLNALEKMEAKMKEMGIDYDRKDF